MILGRSWHQQSIKNRPTIEAQDGLPLSIVFWWVLMVFGRQVGVQSRAKSEVCKHTFKNFRKSRCGAVWHGSLGPFAARIYSNIDVESNRTICEQQLSRKKHSVETKSEQSKRDD